MKTADCVRIKKIIQTWESLKEQLRKNKITYEVVLNDQFSQWAVTTPLYNIGEQVYFLSKETKEAYPEIPWKFVSGLRHRLVHDYEGINWSIIAEVLFSDMDEFINQLRNINMDLPE